MIDELTESESQDEFFEHYNIVADKGQSPLRVDKFLLNRLENASRNRIQNAAKNGYIQVNSQPVKSNYRVKPGDEVSFVLPHPPRNKELVPENIPLDIVYEDEFLLLVNKPPGMVVHPAYGNYTGTLVNGLVYYLENLPEMANQPLPRPGLVHRIDKDTSGLLLIAKHEETMTHLAYQFFNHTINRTYYALVWGDPKEDKGTIDANLMRSLRDRKLVVTTSDPNLGKRAVTNYEVVERYGFAALIRCKLETGRTHQIRVHMKSIGHPIFNDFSYGGDRILSGGNFHRFKPFIDNAFALLPRQGLHAAELGFHHPMKDVFMNFEKEMPPDMASVIQKFRDFHHSYAKL